MRKAEGNSIRGLFPKALDNTSVMTHGHILILPVDKVEGLAEGHCLQGNSEEHTHSHKLVPSPGP